jgi:Carboxypeptidase regulatory-like domain
MEEMEMNSEFRVRIPMALQPALSRLGKKGIFRQRQQRLCSLRVQATSTKLLSRIGVALVLATLPFQTGGPAAFAQATSVMTMSLLTGTVVSSSGHPISGAILILQTSDGRIVAKGESDINGHFRFAGVPTGEYIIVANKDGFDTVAESFVLRSHSGPPKLVLQMEADNGTAVPSVSG